MATGVDLALSVKQILAQKQSKWIHHTATAVLSTVFVADSLSFPAVAGGSMHAGPIGLVPPLPQGARQLSVLGTGSSGKTLFQRPAPRLHCCRLDAVLPAHPLPRGLPRWPCLEGMCLWGFAGL